MPSPKPVGWLLKGGTVYCTDCGLVKIVYAPDGASAVIVDQTLYSNGPVHQCSGCRKTIGGQHPS